MNIALVTETYPPEINGVAMTLQRLVHGLIAGGHDVRVVRPARPDAPVDGPDRSDPRQIHVPGLPIPRYSELRFGLPAANRLRRAWSTWRPDVVHVATEGPLGFSAISTARRLGIAVTSTFHTNFHTFGDHYGYGAVKRLTLAYLRVTHNRTACTLVPTAEMRDELAGVGFRNLGVLGRGVDTDLFTPDARDATLRAEWGAGPTTPVAIYVGRLAVEKNLSTVAAAFDAVRRSSSDAKLVFVGDGPSRPGLQRRYPDAIFAGMRTGQDLARHYASGDLFLFPSLSETFGNVVTEAMASGLVVLAYDYAATRMHVRSQENGVAVPYGDNDAYVAAATAAMASRAAWPSMREAARHTATSIGWDTVVARFEQALQTAATRTDEPAPDSRPLCCAQRTS